MAITQGYTPETRIPLIQHIKNHTEKCGVLALILLAFTGCNIFITWNALRFIERADNQANANLRIGNLEGKMEILLQERQNSSNSACLK